jgi:hypothetical protein
VNLNDNGPEDGGLLVMKGSSALMKEYFDEVGRPPLAPEGEKVRLFPSSPRLILTDRSLFPPRSTGTVRLSSASRRPFIADPFFLCPFAAFKEEEMQWFYDRGCELIKVCADPGDLILWDSSSVLPSHFAARSIRTALLPALATVS